MPGPNLLRSFTQTLVATAILWAGGAAPGDAASHRDGATLYRKHCALCHPETTRLRMADDLMETLRMPPPGMPAFSEEKLSDADVKALGEHVRPAAGKVAPPEGALIAPHAGSVVPQPAPKVTGNVRTGARQAAAVRQPLPKRTWNSGFARTWTIKGRQDDGTVALQRFLIRANADNEPEIGLAEESSDRTVNITTFEITGRTLKLQLAWSWQLNPQYWKTQTYDLRLSDDGTKLTGTLSLRTSGGHSAEAPVWGE